MNDLTKAGKVILLVCFLMLVAMGALPFVAVRGLIRGRKLL